MQGKYAVPAKMLMEIKKCILNTQKFMNSKFNNLRVSCGNSLEVTNRLPASVFRFLSFEFEFSFPSPSHQQVHQKLLEIENGFHFAYALPPDLCKPCIIGL